MNRLTKLFQEKNENVLSIYFSAGHPNLNNTVDIIESIDEAGADVVEVGIPFSDPVADGPVIQQSSLKALKNGITLAKIFEQLKDIRTKTQIPIVMMGYLNPVMQYGIKRFCEKCREIGVDGLIIPDLTPEIFNEQYRNIFEENKLANIMLVTPQTTDSRIKQLDEWSKGFLYIVAASSTTGAKKGFESYQIDYFKRLQNLNLKLPKLIGFGISNHQTFVEALKYANGVIIGSAFVKSLENETIPLKERITGFINSILT